MTIRAGTIEEAKENSGLWVIVDIGFARASTRSCGIWVEGEEATVLNFAAMVERVVNLAQAQGEPLNLVIEAPLSVAFDAQGNPLGRDIERFTNRYGREETRFWYVSLGTTVMVAAAYLLRALVDSFPQRDIHLFEGFVSFKGKGKSDHVKDVKELRQVIFASGAQNGQVKSISAANTGVNITSAFAVFGMDFGIPPVVFVNPS